VFPGTYSNPVHFAIDVAFLWPSTYPADADDRIEFPIADTMHAILDTKATAAVRVAWVRASVDQYAHRPVLYFIPVLDKDTV